MTWQVLVAVIGAWAIAVGAAAQEQPATIATGRPVGRLALVGQLVRNRRWLVGGALTILGVGLHLLALSSAPLTIVQPLGVSGLLVAVWLAARWRGRSLTRFELGGAALVSVGLAGLVLALPHQDEPIPDVGTAELLPLSVAAAAIALIAMLTASRVSPRLRAWSLAAAAGVCFGVASALARIISHHMRSDPMAILHWTTVVAAALIVLGGLILQNAYRSGHFGLAYATLLIADPLVAAGVGVGVLGEPLPATPLAILAAAASGLATVAGVIILARKARNAPANPIDTPLSTTDEVPTKENENVHFDAAFIASPRRTAHAA